MSCNRLSHVEIVAISSNSDVDLYGAMSSMSFNFGVFFEACNFEVDGVREFFSN